MDPTELLSPRPPTCLSETRGRGRPHLRCRSPLVHPWTSVQGDKMPIPPSAQTCVPAARPPRAAVPAGRGFVRLSGRLPLARPFSSGACSAAWAPRTQGGSSFPFQTCVCSRWRGRQGPRGLHGGGGATACRTRTLARLTRARTAPAGRRPSAPVLLSSQPGRSPSHVLGAFLEPVPPRRPFFQRTRHCPHGSRGAPSTAFSGRGGRGPRRRAVRLRGQGRPPRCPAHGQRRPRCSARLESIKGCDGGKALLASPFLIWTLLPFDILDPFLLPSVSVAFFKVTDVSGQ